MRSVKCTIGTISGSIECVLAKRLSNVGGKPCKLSHTRGDSLPQAVFTSPASIHHRFFCNQDCLVVRVLNHIVNEDGHAFAQPHLKVLLMRHVTGLLAEMFHWQCFNHYWIREQKEGIAVPLNPYMVDAVMGGEEIRDLHPWGGIRLLLAQPPDMVTAPQSLFFSRPGRLYWRKLGGGQGPRSGSISARRFGSEEDSETFCRDRLRFTAALFTKTRVVKLRLRSPLSGIANCFTRMFKLTAFC